MNSNYFLLFFGFASILNYGMEMPEKPKEKPKITVISDQKSWELEQDIVFQAKTLAHQVKDVNQAYLPPSISADSFDLAIPFLDLVNKIKNNEAEKEELSAKLKECADNNKLVTLAIMADYADAPILNQSCIQEIAGRFTDSRLIKDMLKSKDSEYHTLPQTLQYNVADESTKKNKLLQRLFFAQNRPLFKAESVPLNNVEMNGKTGHVAARGADGAVYFWNLATGAFYGRLVNTNPRNYVRAVAFNKKGTALLTGNDNRTIGIWNFGPFQETKYDGIRKTAGSNILFLKLGFLDNDTKFFSFDNNYDIHIWDLSGKLLKKWQHADDIKQLEHYSHADNWLVTADKSTVNLFNFLTQKQTQLTTQAKTTIYAGHRGTQYMLSNVSAIQVNPNGKQLAVGFGNGQIAHFDLTKPVIDGEYAPETIDLHSEVKAIACDPIDGTIAAGYTGSIDGRGSIIVWNPRSKETYRLNNEEEVKALSFNANGNLLAATSGKQIKIWNLPLKQCVQILTNDCNEGIHKAVFVDDHHICATDYGCNFITWKTHDPQRIKQVKDLTISQLACLLYFLDAAENKSPMEITDSIREILVNLPNWAKDYIHHLLPVKERVGLYKSAIKK